MNIGILFLFLVCGSAVGALGWQVLRRARSPAPVRAAPAVAVTALLWAAAAWQWASGAWPASWLPVALTVTGLAVPLALADLRHQRLPDVLTLPAYPLLGTAVLVAAFTRPGAGQGVGAGTGAEAGPGVEAAVRAVAGGVVFGGVHLFVHALSRRSLGAGDVKLAGALGIVFGVLGWEALLVAAVLAAGGTVLLSLRSRWPRGVPHGPGLLTAACLLTLFPGPGSEVVRLGPAP